MNPRPLSGLSVQNEHRMYGAHWGGIGIASDSTLLHFVADTIDASLRAKSEALA